MISGVIRGLNPEASTVTLKKLEKLNEKNFLVNVANTQMDSDGSFEFEAKAASEYGYYQLFAGGHAVVLVTGPSEDLFIEVDAVEGEKYFLRPKIQGSQQTKAVAAYYDVIFPLEQRLRNEELKSRSSDPQIARWRWPTPIQTRQFEVCLHSVLPIVSRAIVLTCRVGGVESIGIQGVVQSHLGCLASQSLELSLFQKTERNLRANEPSKNH